MYSVIIIGSGPAACTAALYLARANLKPLLLKGPMSGGLLTTTSHVENFPGFPEGIDGYELTTRFSSQCQRFGTEIKSETVESIMKTEWGFQVVTKQNSYTSRAVLIATGSTPRKLSVPGFEEFWNRGVSTCAVCDGALPCFQDVPIAIVGGGDSACEEALHMTNFASQVYLIHRRDQLRASPIMRSRVLQHPKIKVLWNTEIQSIKGEEMVQKVVIRDQNGVHSDLEVGGVFVAIGHDPNTGFLDKLVETDPQGYIVTDYNLRTNVPGIWAAGDVQDHKYRQAITAAGQGCVAALEIQWWLETKEPVTLD